MDALFNKTINRLSDLLDYRTKRHKIIVSNIANLDTAGFKPSDLSFKDELGAVGKITMATTNPGHIQNRNHPAGGARYDLKRSEENVNIDTEMSSLAENNLMYHMTVEMLARKFKGINVVLKEAK